MSALAWRDRVFEMEITNGIRDELSSADDFAEDIESKITEERRSSRIELLSRNSPRAPGTIRL